MSTKVSCISSGAESISAFTAGVSLHSHTKYSHEKLQFIPDFTQKWPMLHRALEYLCKKAPIPVDFSRAYWTPPLSPRMALDLERSQIEDVLGLAGLVSLTDHDSIEAPSLLRMTTETAEIPISLEWSVPFCGSEFHLGVHNLPSELAPGIVDNLLGYTQNSTGRNVSELLATLHRFPEVLVVFNHPFWDLTGVGQQEHRLHIHQFMEQNGSYVHAMELNGLRKWEENRKVKPLAERWQLPLISGGDRHAWEPSAVVNLSNARSFSEFAAEIRYDRQSHVLFMAQYNEPMFTRVMRSLLDVIRHYPEYPEGTRHWDDRVFYPDRSGENDLPLSAFWKASPAFIESIFSCLRLSESSAVEWTLKRFYAEPIDLLLPSEAPSEAVS